MRLWIGMDPGYDERKRAVGLARFAWKRDAADRPYTPIMPPVSFERLRLEAITDTARGMADRFRRRAILRRDDHEIPDLGRVAAFVVSNPDVLPGSPGGTTRPNQRWTVGPTASGLRILRADLVCVRCRCTGGPGKTGCGFSDDLSETHCERGWLSRGGISLDLSAPSTTERLVRPEDARWHPWFDA